MRQVLKQAWKLFFSRALLVSLALSTVNLEAQSVAGIWQGTLSSGQDPRIVIELNPVHNETLRGSLLFIDRGATGSPLLSATFKRPDLTLAIGDITYSGKLSPDGHTLTGTWTRGGQSSPLTFTLATPETLWTYTGPAVLPSMLASANPVFEVATIKPSRPDAREAAIISRAHIFQAKDSTFLELLKYAYRLRDRQIQNAPAWAKDLHFDISAEPDLPGQPNPRQARAMLQKLLADRFSFQFHTTHPVSAVYVLTRDANATQLTRSQLSSNGYMSIYVHDQPDGNTAVQFASTDMPDFLDTLMNFIPDRQILDETGLTGQYDFTLAIPTSTVHGDQGPDVPDKTTAFLTALPHAGFKLVPQKEPLEVFVIDRLEKPSAN